MINLSKYDRQLITAELKFETSRSGGKGGQHVNKTESKVTLVFDLNESKVLTEDQKERIQSNLGPRIKSGVIRVSSESNRSQYRNKSDAISRFFNILENSLQTAKPRVASKLPKSVKRKRLKAKKLHQDKKELRKKVRNTDY